MQPEHRRSAHHRRGGAQLAAFLREAQDAILARWEEVTRDIASLGDLPWLQRVDPLPFVLQHLAAVAEEIEEGWPARDHGHAATRHARQRLAQGFDLPTVVHELTLLRATVIELWNRIAPSDREPLRLLDRVMDEAINASVEEYVNAREHALRAIDVVSALALEARSIDELFDRLLHAFTSSMRAVDVAAILLFERGRLTTRASVGLEPEVAEHFTVRPPTSHAPPEGFAELISRRREPVYVPDQHDREVAPETPRARRVRALFGVPLLDRDEVIGVAYMGSLTARTFSKLDRQLFSSMAIRATAGISQHLERELAHRRTSELAASEQRFRATFANASVGIAHVGLDGRWLRVNPRYCQILGFDPDQLASLRYQDLTSPTDLLQDAAAARALLDGRLEIYETEKRYLRNDGRTVWVRLRASLARDDDAGPPYFIAIVVDITEQKAVEAALRAREEQASRALAREREAHLAAERALAALDSLLVAAPAGVSFIDTELRWVRVNETLAQMNGATIEEHLGRTVRDVLGARADEIEPWLRRVIESGEVVVRELVGRTPSDAHVLRSFLVSLFPVRAATGDILGVGGIVMDITERKLIEDALRASEQHAQRSVRLREQVLAVVSHDLRNPLGAIRMSVGLLLQLGTLEPEERRYTEVVDRAASRMERMISDLLDLGSIESGRLALDLQPHDVGAILTDACELQRVIARTKNIELACAEGPAGAIVRCDRERVLQVLGNLVGNAIKFCDTNDKITLGFEHGDREVVITVSDTGPGVPPEEIDHMFAAYWTTARSAAQGTGLGLYISKGIIEAHGGRIGARNRPPRGAMFWFTLPVATG